MASAGSADQSSCTSSDSGRTARFGGGSPTGDKAFATLVVVSGPAEEPIAIGDTTEGLEFVDAYFVADAATQSLTSSLTASNVYGANGSSETRRKSRSPPRGTPGRLGPSLLGTPSSRGTRRSGVSPATTPTRVKALTGAETLLSSLTRKSSAGSIHSDPCGGLASTSAEQSTAQMAASTQEHLMRDRQEYGP